MSSNIYLLKLQRFIIVVHYFELCSIAAEQIAPQVSLFSVSILITLQLNIQS